MKKIFKLILILIMLIGVGFSIANFTTSSLDAFGGGTIHWKGTMHADKTYCFGCWGPYTDCEMTFEI